MKLTELYRPRCLDDIVGQPCILRIKGFVKSPHPCCFVFVGPPGVGKSATALAMAAELGAIDGMTGLRVVNAASLGKDDADELLYACRMRPLNGGWNVLILEEFERLSPQCQIYLKVALASENLPKRLIVVATSNDISRFDEALLERFGRPLSFLAGAQQAEAYRSRLAMIWIAQQTGQPFPSHWLRWGWVESPHGKRFSYRRALDDMQAELQELCAA